MKRARCNYSPGPTFSVWSDPTLRLCHGWERELPRDGPLLNGTKIIILAKLLFSLVSLLQRGLSSMTNDFCKGSGSSS